MDLFTLLAWLITFLCALAGILFLYQSPKKHSKSPPLIGQFWLPFLGCAISFGKDPPRFLLDCKEKHGNIFTLNVAGKSMTFLFDHDLFDVFFAPSKSNQMAVHAPLSDTTVDAVSFDHGVQEFTARVFGMPTDQFLDEHQILLTSLRTAISPSTGLPMYIKKLHEHLMEMIDERFEKTERVDDLFEVVSELLFFGSMRSLLGNKFFELASKNMNDESETEYVTFKRFDKWFELAASGYVPHQWLPGFLQSKNHLLTRLINLRKEMEKNKMSESTDSSSLFETLLESLERNGRANSSEKEFAERSEKHTLWGLALLWASQANSLPATFWTLVHLLNHDDCMEQVKKEIENILVQYPDTDHAELFTPDNLPYLTACVKEGIRLQSPGIMIRKVCRSVKLPTTVNGKPVTYIVPKGHTLCVSPYAIHRDESIFPQPEKFNPNRWLIVDKKHLEKMRKAFIPFGRGQNLCPGMNFAMYEMLCFLATFINKFPHIHLKGTASFVPDADVSRMIGVPYPKKPVPVSLFK